MPGLIGKLGERNVNRAAQPDWYQFTVSRARAEKGTVP
jgi:hypothetical protein